MSPEKALDLEQLAAVERVITALLTLQSECDARDLKKLAKYIDECTVKCQSEYVAFHRRIYESGGGNSTPPKTEH